MGNEDLAELLNQLRTAASAGSPPPILLPLIDRLQIEVLQITSECDAMRSRLERPLASAFCSHPAK